MKKSRQHFITAFLVMIPAIFIFFPCATIQDWVEKPSPKTPELLAQGRKLYEDNCVQYHGPNGDGKGWKTADLKKKPRDFTLLFDQWTYSKGDPKKIFRVLKAGIPDTPRAMFHFTDEQRWPLVFRVIEFNQVSELAK